MKKEATSWHKEMKKKVVWPIKRLMAEKKLLQEGFTKRVQGVDGEKTIQVAKGRKKTSFQRLGEEIDLWDEFDAIIEEWMNLMLYLAVYDILVDVFYVEEVYRVM